MGMLHAVATTLGRVMRPLHAGDDKLVARRLHRNATPTIDVMSPSFVDGQPIPRRHAQQGDNFSPGIGWGRLPRGTRELVLMCEDPDAPMAHPYVHWIVYGMTPDATGLPAGIPKVGEPRLAPGPRIFQGVNGAKKDGYAGPAPPPGHGLHHYHFQLFALSDTIHLAPGTPATRENLVDVMRGHVIAHGELVGTYERT